MADQVARKATATDRPVPDRLLAVATRLFAARGFERTSVQEIVDAAGVTKGAMYHYFDSKDDLLHEIYRRLLSMQTKALERIADGPGTAVDRLREAAADVVVSTLAHLDDAVVLMNSLHLLAPHTRARVRAERRRYHERFRALVDEGRHEGSVRSDVSADLATHHFFGAVHHLGSWYRAEGSLRPREVGEGLAEMFLTGIARTEKGAQPDAGKKSPAGAAGTFGNSGTSPEPA
ncbi:TetR/AcrR family transcriptional regulator [Wenjunlia tyrosinilytica]|uniref:TetR family transcriptional regulator n=1 Tax=Wenjunlia tyrosinilytica TaxID=1544741 RepID=A0A918DW88_9ACTN|nr:TetR/AcrR family transcriptional regulator [Wenjunlia tyrosinilytica]GGO84435.1 TetR family transcriptional regulator [Wenjunlia tyrosinilytica]